MMKRYEVEIDPECTSAQAFVTTLATDDLDAAYTEAWERFYAGRSVRIYDHVTEWFLPF